MTDSRAQRWARIESLFHQAADLASEERTAFLDQACGEDAELRAAVQALLDAEDGAEDFLEAPIASVSTSVAGADAPGSDTPTQIGPYHVVRPIGAGGMGEVYLGFEEGPDYRNYVALKVVREGVGPGFDDRFARERAILAQLEHPGIARFLGGGTTDDGRAYFVMEYVEGERIDVYCDRERLTIDERVALFRDVCLSVQRAHSNLVVHRDLKPDNILVTADGTPKLLDFGIAKLLDDTDAELTKTGAWVATPAYAAPEQLVGDPVSTSADVFALGVLLFESLSGSRAFAGMAPAARLRATADDAQTPPSAIVAQTRVGADPESAAAETVGANRGTTISALRRGLRGDLDNIVLKAMSYDAGDRYVSAAALADDLERYLTGQPVRARAASLAYRTQKFIRRNRVAVLAAAALGITVLGAAIATGVQNAQIREQSERLVVERDRALEVQAFLLESFGAAGSGQLAGDSLTVRAVLDGRAEQVPELYADDPATRAEMQHVLADGYERIGMFDEARVWAERAVSDRRALVSDPHDVELARSVGLLGWIHHQLTDYDQAEMLLQEALVTWRAIGTDTVFLSRTLNDLSGALLNQGRLEEAETAAREALGLRRDIYPSGHLAIAITANNLASILGGRGEHADALALLEESSAALEASLGPNHRRTLRAKDNMAVAHAWLGDWARSAEIAGEVANTYEETGRAGEIGHLTAIMNHAVGLGGLGDYDGSEAALARAYALATDRLGDHRETGAILTRRANVAVRRGQRLEGLGYARDAAAMYERLLGDHALLAAALRHVGSLTVDRQEQIEAYLSSAEMYERLEGPQGVNTVRGYLNLARSLAAAGRHAEALPVFAALAETIPIAFGDDHGFAPAPYLGQAEAHVTLGDLESAELSLNEARRRMTGAADVQPNQQWLARVEQMLASR